MQAPEQTQILDKHNNKTKGKNNKNNAKNKNNTEANNEHTQHEIQ